MKPYYQDKWVTIYHGDCREILPTLEPVDLVLTDPPYGISYAGAEWDKELFSNIIVWLLPLIKEKLNIGCHAFIWCPFIDINSFDGVFIAAKNFGHYRNNMRWMQCWNPIGVLVKGTPRENIIGGKNYYESYLSAITAQGNGNNYRRYDHQTPKPDDTNAYIIAHWSIGNDTILDPFLGSGTTCYCAKKLNRKSIGIEIEEKYCEIAAKRCMQTVMELGI